MLANPSLIVVATGEHPMLAVHTSSVHHSYFPEVRGEGCSLMDATARLTDLLCRTLDNAASEWRRQTILEAIEDVRAFGETGR
jgi:hypothetical protein